ncbi:MAG: electron transport complex subunit RsxC [Candidatus Omnitrophota bacterium]
MARLEENKFYTAGKRIEPLPFPTKVYIPIIQHLGKPCDKIEVKTGDTVLKGQLIAHSDAKVFSPIHASVSGKITAIQDWPHPVLGKAKTIILENDMQEQPQNHSLREPEEIKKLSPAQIREIVFKAGIVGMGGASFPTHIKLNPPKPLTSLIINIAECEPYLTGDSQLTVEKTQEILLGISLISKCLSTKETIIAIEENKPQAIQALKAAINEQLTVNKAEQTPSNENQTLKIAVLKSRYPQGGEKQLIKSVLGKEIPRGKLPFDVGASVQNVSTVFAIFEAVYNNKPLIERVVTVTGSILAAPKNILCRIGTPLKELIDFCGPLKEEPAKIIVGGPMMGIAQFTDMAPVIKSTTGVIVLNQAEARQKEENYCIRCGACIRECTMGLMPCLINQSAEKELWEQAKNYGILDCVECGLCAFVCPSNRKIVQSIKRAKLELNK